LPQQEEGQKLKNKIYLRYANFNAVKSNKVTKAPGHENHMPPNTFYSHMGCWLS
jgi:hypothetical protein